MPTWADSETRPPHSASTGRTGLVSGPGRSRSSRSLPRPERAATGARRAPGRPACPDGDGTPSLPKIATARTVVVTGTPNSATRYQRTGTRHRRHLRTRSSDTCATVGRGGDDEGRQPDTEGASDDPVHRQIELRNLDPGREARSARPQGWRRFRLPGTSRSGDEQARAALSPCRTWPRRRMEQRHEPLLPALPQHGDERRRRDHRARPLGRGRAFVYPAGVQASRSRRARARRTLEHDERAVGKLVERGFVVALRARAGSTRSL